MLILQQKDHPKFKRKGDDLFVEHTLSLTEALCGFQFVLTHLDNRQLLIKSNPGEVVKPGMTSGRKKKKRGDIYMYVCAASSYLFTCIHKHCIYEYEIFPSKN